MYILDKQNVFTTHFKTVSYTSNSVVVTSRLPSKHKHSEKGGKESSDEVGRKCLYIKSKFDLKDHSDYKWNKCNFEVCKNKTIIKICATFNQPILPRETLRLYDNTDTDSTYVIFKDTHNLCVFLPFYFEELPLNLSLIKHVRVQDIAA